MRCMRSRSCRGGTQLVSARGRPDGQGLGRVDGEAPRSPLNDSLDSVYTVAVHPSGRSDRGRRCGPDDPHVGLERGRALRRPGRRRDRCSASTFAHGESVLRLAYSPDGATLASAGADRVIKLWDARDAEEKQRLRSAARLGDGPRAQRRREMAGRRPLRRHARPLRARRRSVRGTVRGAAVTAPEAGYRGES